MAVRTGPVRLLITISFILLIIILGSCVTVPYEPDTAALEKYRIQEEQRAEEFSEWVKGIHSENPQPVISLGHSDWVNSVAFSPNGLYAISGSNDKTLKLWEVATGQLIQTIEADNITVETSVFSPDGRFILTGGGKINLWDITNGELIQTMDSTGVINSVAFSPLGQYALSGSGDSSINIWDIPSGKLIRSMDGHTESVNCVAFSPDGLFAVSGAGYDKDFTVRLWEISTGRQIWAKKKHKSAIKSVSFSPDGSYILSGSRDEMIKVWETSSGKVIRKLAGHEGSIESVTFSPNGRFILSGSLDNTIKIWDASSGELLQTMTGHSGPVGTVAFSPDNKYILSGSRDYTLKLWDFATKLPIRTFGGIPSKVSSVAFTPNGQYIVSATGIGSRGQIHNYPMQTKDLLIDTIEYYKTLGKDFSSLEIMLDAKDTTIKIWNNNSGELVRILEGHSNDVKCIAISPNGQNILSGSRDHTIKLWDISTGKLLQKLEGHSNRINSVAFSPDGKHAISGSSDNTIMMWDVVSGKLLKTLEGNTGNISSVTYSPDGKFILSAISATPDTDPIIKLWDAENGEFIRSFSGNKWKAVSLAFSPNGKYILSGNMFSEISLWEAATGKIIRSIEGHGDTIYSIAYSHDGKYFITGSEDKDIKLWNATTFNKIITLKGHSSHVNSVTFSPDGHYLLSGSDDGTQKLWSIPDGKLIYTSMANSKGEYLTWTPEGYFSGSENLAREAIAIVDGLTTYSIDQFFDTYYRPDIIQAKIAGKDITELFGNNRLVDDIAPTPGITIEVERTDGTFRSIISAQDNYKITEGTVQVKITAADQGGGAEEIRLFHNGVRVAGITRGISVASNSNTITQTFTIQLTDGQNTLRALAFTSNRIESTPASITLNYNAPIKVDPTLWVLAVGINEYKNGKYNLNYAVSDAGGFIKAVLKSGKSLFSKIETTLLTDSQATKESISSAIKKITASSKPEDVFMFFYAGHGIALELPETERTEFFFIPTDVTQMTDLAKVMDMGISGPEFEILVSSIPARKQFLVLDACNSGAINTAFGVRGAAEEIALSRLSRATGSALIAASRDDQFAQEFAALGQGALTKALLDGLGGDAALTNGQITVGSLKGYVESALPGLTELYAGQAQYPTGFIFGQDFPIGVK